MPTKWRFLFSLFSNYQLLSLPPFAARAMALA
jgi:hypothetical protein